MRNKVGPFCRLLLVLSCCSPTLSFAQGTAVALGTLGPDTCVTRSELADALRRSGLAVDAAASTVVGVSGSPGALVVNLRGGRPDFQQRLAPACCETATDLVAAFVTSSVAPPPVVAVAPLHPSGPPLDPAAVAMAIEDALARRRPAPLRNRAAQRIEPLPGGEWRVKITDPAAPVCSRSARLGRFEDLSPERIEAARRVDADAGALHDLCTLERLRSRAYYLRRAVGEELDRRPTYDLDAGWLAFEGILSIALDSLPPEPHLGFQNVENGLITSGSAIWIGGGVAGLIVPRDYKKVVLEASFLSGLGAMWTARALVKRSDYAFDAPVPPVRIGEATYAHWSLAGASFATAGLLVADAALGPPPLERLKSAFEDMQQPNGLEYLDEARVASTEGDLESLEPHLPGWVVYGPMIAGGAAAIAPAIADGFHSWSRSLTALWGAGYVGFGIWGALPVHPYRDYRRALKKAGIVDVSVGLGPGGSPGMSLSGRF